MTLLLDVIIAGMAAGFTADLLSFILSPWVDPKATVKIMTVPFAVGALWLLSVHTVLLLVVLSPAAAFFAMVVMLIVNRPVQIQQVLNRRNLP